MLYLALALIGLSAYVIGRTRPIARLKAQAWEDVVWAHYVRQPVSNGAVRRFLLLYPFVGIFRGWWRAVRPQLPGRASVDLAEEFAARGIGASRG